MPSGCLSCSLSTIGTATVRGPAEARHDREEARIHAADIIAVTGVQADMKTCRQDFENQFSADPALGLRVLRILDSYSARVPRRGCWCMRNTWSETSLLIAPPEARLPASLPEHSLMLGLLPPTLFFQLLAGIEDCCDLERSSPLVEAFRLSLDRSGISIYSQDALPFIPTVVYGGAFSRGDKFVVSTGELLAQLTETELALVRQHLFACAERLETN